MLIYIETKKDTERIIRNRERDDSLMHRYNQLLHEGAITLDGWYLLALKIYNNEDNQRPEP